MSDWTSCVKHTLMLKKHAQQPYTGHPVQTILVSGSYAVFLAGWRNMSPFNQVKGNRKSHLTLGGYLEFPKRGDWLVGFFVGNDDSLGFTHLMVGNLDELGETPVSVNRWYIYIHNHPIENEVFFLPTWTGWMSKGQPEILSNSSKLTGWISASSCDKLRQLWKSLKLKRENEASNPSIFSKNNARILSIYSNLVTIHTWTYDPWCSNLYRSIGHANICQSLLSGLSSLSNMNQSLWTL